MLKQEVKPSEEIAKPPIEEGHRQTVRKLTLFAALPAQVLLQSFDAGFIDSTSDRSALLKAWQRASEAYNLAGNSFRSYANADDVRDIDGVDNTRIESILKRAKQYAP